MRLAASAVPSPSQRAGLAPFLLLGLVLWPVVAAATPARVVALGDIARYLEDDTSVQLYPGQLPRHTHLLVLDLTQAGGTPRPSPAPTSLDEVQQGGVSGGAFLRLRDGFSVGILTSSYAPLEYRSFLQQVAANSHTGNDAAFLLLAELAPRRQYDLLAALELGAGLTSGLRLSWGGDQRTYVPDNRAGPQTEEDRRPDAVGVGQFRMTAGLSGRAGGHAWDLALDYAHFSGTYLKKGREAFVSGALNGLFGASARGRLALSRHWELVPQLTWRGGYFGIREDSAIPLFGADDRRSVSLLPGPEDGPTTASRLHELTSHVVDGGAAAVLRASPKTRFWLVLGSQWRLAARRVQIDFDEGIQGRRGTDEQAYSLPYVKLAVETAPFEWLRLRAAAEKHAWASSTRTYRSETRPERVEEDATSTTSADPGLPDFTTTVGASLLLAGFELDLVVDSGFLVRGPSAISGAEGDLALRASLAHRF